ncbi:PIN domain-containing protein [Candidatus Pacearchaeota archaeon]|nr:PIN domain-containing protein [Candidatus Pacearchaeota archaeon]
METYFFDSYAVMEILKGNKNYDKYKDSDIVLTKLNLFEIYHNILKQFNEELAEEIINKYKVFAIDFDESVIKEAAKFRIQNIKKGISMTDCIGYILAKNIDIRFLTGDKEFEKLDNVEFVK